MRASFVVVNRRPILQALSELLNRLDVDVTVMTSSSSITGAGQLDQLRRVAAVEVLEDYDSPKTDLLVLQECLRVGARGLASTTEFDVVRCAFIRERLGIAGQSLTSALAFRNKWLMKSFLARHGVRVARGSLANNDEELRAVLAIGDRWVVKPVDGVASKETFVFCSEREVRAYLATQRSRLGALLVEQYVDAPMFHVDGLAIAGEVVIAIPSEYLHTQLATMRESRSNLSAMLAPSDRSAKLLLESVACALRALPAVPQLHAFHAEYFLGSDLDPVLCEVACRAGGAGIVEAFSRSTGLDLYVEPLEAQLASERTASAQVSELRGRVKDTWPRWGWGWFPPRDGVLAQVPCIAPFARVERYETVGSPGKVYGPPSAVTDAIATMSFSLASTENGADALREIDSWWRDSVKWQRDAGGEVTR